MEYFKKFVEQGLQLHKKGETKEAIDLYLKALSYKSNNPQLLYLVGTANLEIGVFENAINFLEKTISLEPNNIRAYNNLGAAFQNLKRYEEAIKIYEKLIVINPDFSEAYNNLGNCLAKFKRYDEAIRNYNKAIKLNSKNFVAFTNLGNVQKELFNYNEAINNYKKSITLNKNYLLAYSNLGNSYHEIHKYKNALENYKKIFEVDKNYKFLLGRLIHSQMYLCEWENLSNNMDYLISALKKKKQICLPFVSLNIIDNPELHKVSAEISFEDKTTIKNISLNKYEKKGGDKYKIGYFSPDFRNHPVLHLIKDVFKHHDKSKFEIYAFSMAPEKNDEMTKEIKPYFTEFIEIKNLSNKEIRDLCHKKNLDIAIDLCGFTSFNRFEIFAQRLAPIQVNYLGYPGTMGSNFFDNIIADKVIITKEEEKHYTEKVVYLPNCYQPNSSYEVLQKNNHKKKKFNLPEDKVIFCNLGSNHKITPQIFKVWMGIMQKVPDSVLWLLKPNEIAINNIKEEATKQGINQERIIFGNKLSHEEHLQRLKLADIFLDTYPYNAHTTASDVIRMGVPIITLYGRSFASRVCASILSQVNMSKLSTNSMKNYEEIAVQLGNNTSEIKKIKKEIENNCLDSSLFKIIDFTKDLESIFINLIDEKLTKKIN